MKVKICTGTKCMFYGADGILDNVVDLQENLTEYPNIPEGAHFEVEVVPCDESCKKMGRTVSPLVLIDDERMEKASSPVVMEKILDKLQEE